MTSAPVTTLFTYARPFLPGASQLRVSARSLVLLLMGAGGLFGTWLLGRLVARSLSMT